MLKKYILPVLLIGLIQCSACQHNAKQEKGGRDEVVVQSIPAEEAVFGGGRLVNLALSDNMKDILCQHWVNKDDLEFLSGENDASLQDLPVRSYSFFNDGSMVKQPRGYVQTGTWELDEQQKPYAINIKYSNGKKEKMLVAQLAPNRLIIAKQEDKTILRTTFKGEAYSHKNITEDPFHPQNLGWRIKPDKPENTAQIRQRLKDGIHFFVLFYEQEVNAGSNEVYFTGMPSCYKWYAGGIYLYKKEELSDLWLDCFYDKEQAMQAYAMADELLSHKYQWPKGEKNWLKQNLAVLRQMEKKME